MGDLVQRLAEWHAGHDCAPAKCACKCGCDVELGCTALGPLCSVCTVRDGRGDEAHAEPATRKTLGAGE